MTDIKRYRHRFPMLIIQHAVWLYHRFLLSFLARAALMTTLGHDQDAQEVLHQRGIQESHEILREWCIKFGPPAKDLRHRKSRWDFRWHLDEVCTSVDGVRQWL